MARAKSAAEQLLPLKLGDAIELASFFPALPGKVVATVVAKHGSSTMFDASFHGIHIGMLHFDPEQKKPYIMEPAT